MSILIEKTPNPLAMKFTSPNQIFDGTDSYPVHKGESVIIRFSTTSSHLTGSTMFSVTKRLLPSLKNQMYIGIN